MKDFTKIYFVVAWVVSLILGIFYSITLIGLIVGIPLFICMSKFKAASKMKDDELIAKRKNLLGWGVFLAVMLAPTILGLIIALILVLLVNNYICDLEKGNLDSANKSFSQTIKDGAKKMVGTSLEDKLKELVEHNPSLEEKINNDQYCVTYGIISNKNRDLKSDALPLFSRISLLRCVKTLRLMQIITTVFLIKDNVDRKCLNEE